jgi:translation initiation factor 2B subunit (eIF-2B alpha/beta/delta family)
VFAELHNKIPHTLTIVTPDKAKYNPEKVVYPLVELKNSSSVIKTADMVVIPCSAVLKDGGIIARSGSIMLAIAAKNLSVPVVALATCYSLTNRFCF